MISRGNSAVVLAATPPMGWNSWNTFGPAIDEEVILESAEALVSSGLREAGYDHVVIDDVWQAQGRTADGLLHWDTERFPMGIPALAERVHGLGLKFGIYTCVGTHTCEGLPGSFGHEEADANLFAEWGVDFVKVDFCHCPSGVDGRILYKRFGQALRATGRPMVHSVCEWGTMRPWEWASARAGGHLWRTTEDIHDMWESIETIGFEKQRGLEKFAGPGHWNDPDMLVVGMRGKGHVGRGGCSDAEYRTHFGLWCLLAAPLMIGADVRRLDETSLATLCAPEVIAVNQDPLGRQGHFLTHSSSRGEVCAKPLADGSVAVGLFNRDATVTNLVAVGWEAVGIDPSRPCLVRDLWAREDLGIFSVSHSERVEPHGSSLIRLTPQP